MVNVGIVGIGFMGATHFKALQGVKGARVAAICTRDEKKLAGDWRGVQGNFGDSGGRQDLSRVKCYRDLEELLQDDSIDLVDICLPTSLHRDAAIAALRAGKHVLVEKPIALNLQDADAMLDAAREAKRLLMVAHVLRFFPAFAAAREIAVSGKYGAILGVHLKRIIGRKAPEVADKYFRADGGPSLDLHIHDTDYILHLLGVPTRVQTSGYAAANGDLLYLNSQYLFDDKPVCATAQCGAVGEAPTTFEHGFDIYLEGATLRFNNLFTGDDICICANGRKKILRPRHKEAFAAQLQHAVQCVRENRESDLISAENARTALAICLLEKQSALTGKAQKVPRKSDV